MHHTFITREVPMRALPLSLVALLVLSVAVPSPALAATLDVGPGAPFATPQAAIDAAASGDTVRIAPGTFRGPLTIDGKSLTLVGAGPGVILDGGGAGAVLTVTGATSTTLTALTLTHGQGSRGGALSVDGGALTLSQVELVANAAAEGGALWLSGGSLQMRACVVEDNAADHFGGILVVRGEEVLVSETALVHNRGLWGSAASLDARAVRVERSLFLENGWDAAGAPVPGGMPLVLRGELGGRAEVVNNTFVRSGCCNIGVSGLMPVTIRDNLLVGGAGYGLTLLPAVPGGAAQVPEVSFNLLWDNALGEMHRGDPAGPGAEATIVVSDGNGNLAADPRFVRDDPAADWRVNDYHLAAGSPAIDAGGRRPSERDADGSRNDLGMFGGTPR